jgi:hypothetical protein
MIVLYKSIGIVPRLRVSASVPEGHCGHRKLQQLAISTENKKGIP